MGKVKDEKGNLYGRLKVLSLSHIDKKHNAVWKCVCSCSNELNVIARDLRNGHTKSCGCINRKHGLSKHPLYDIWSSIIGRCHRPKNKAFDNYGGRGIKVCNEWRKDFLAFFKFAKNNGWRRGLDIDRCDNSDGYNPSNCRFVTRSQNMRNTRSNVFITMMGEKKCLTDWAILTGIDRRTISKRLKRGWTQEQALTTPVGQKRK